MHLKENNITFIFRHSYCDINKLVISIQSYNSVYHFTIVVNIAFKVKKVNIRRVIGRLATF